MGDKKTMVSHNLSLNILQVSVTATNFDLQATEFFFPSLILNPCSVHMFYWHIYPSFEVREEG